MILIFTFVHARCKQSSGIRLIWYEYDYEREMLLFKPTSNWSSCAMVTMTPNIDIP